MNTKLREPRTLLTSLLRSCTPEQRLWLAEQAGTTVNYLYLLAGCHRQPGTALAVAIEDASRALHARAGTPIITVREIATMCELAEFEPLATTA